ncbi:hypothetical protein ACOMHN_003364 [Nucella lapillus]
MHADHKAEASRQTVHADHKAEASTGRRLNLKQMEKELGLGVSLHHATGSRHVVDRLHRLGFSLSYNEVKLFEMCAAVQQGTDLVGVDPKTSWIQFAADNVDHQIRTLDGTGTFHGMGIIGAATPGTKECRAVRRDTSVTPDRISALGRVPVHFYNPSSVDLSLVYEILQDFAVEDRTRKLDLLWKVSWPLRSPRLGWSGMMQTICSGAYPGKSSFTLLPMIDMDPTNMSCIFSTLHFVSSVASRYDCTPVLTFDQPLWWKSTMIIDGEPPNSPLCSIVLRLGGFHCQMSFLGCIGRLMAGSGLKQVLEVAFASNSVIHMLSGKSVSRAVRGHFLVDTVLNALVTSIAFNIPLKTCSLTDAEDMDSEAGIGGSSSSPAFLPDETLTVLSLHQQQDEATTSAEVQNTADCTQDHSALRAVLRVFDSTISKETATEEFNEKANKDLDVTDITHPPEWLENHGEQAEPGADNMDTSLDPASRGLTSSSQCESKAAVHTQLTDLVVKKEPVSSTGSESHTLPLSSMGLQHWMEALVDPRFNPVLPLVDIYEVVT